MPPPRYVDAPADSPVKHGSPNCAIETVSPSRHYRERAVLYLPQRPADRDRPQGGGRCRRSLRSRWHRFLGPLTPPGGAKLARDELTPKLTGCHRLATGSWLRRTAHGGPPRPPRQAAKPSEEGPHGQQSRAVRQGHCSSRWSPRRHDQSRCSTWSQHVGQKCCVAFVGLLHCPQN